MSDRYRLVVAGPAARALAFRLPEKVSAAAYEFMAGPLLDNPRRVGKPLRPPMDPTWSARRGSYRILYLIDDDGGVVTVTAVSHRADAYRV